MHRDGHCLLSPWNIDLLSGTNTATQSINPTSPPSYQLPSIPSSLRPSLSLSLFFRLLSFLALFLLCARTCHSPRRHLVHLVPKHDAGAAAAAARVRIALETSTNLPSIIQATIPSVLPGQSLPTTVAASALGNRSIGADHWHWHVVQATASECTFMRVLLSVCLSVCSCKCTVVYLRFCVYPSIFMLGL